MNVTEAVHSFILACQADGLAPRTVESYQTRLAPLIKQIGEVQIEAVTVNDLRGYIASLYKGRSVHTVHGHVRALKRFFRWLIEEGIITENPAARIRLPRLPEAPPKAISDGDLRRLLRAAQQSGKEWERKRNVALVLFLADTGCRLGGLLSLCVTRIDLNARTAQVQEKGGQWRFVFLHPITTQALREWLEARATLSPDNDAVWIAEDGHPLNRWGIHSLLRRLRRQAGVKGPAGAHSFRHRFAIRYLVNGGDLASLADLMGHRDVEVTKQYYARFLVHELREKHDKFSPVMNIITPSEGD